jgi:hypothetical protein
MLTSGVSFPNFNDSSGLILLGDAQITLDDRLRVIDASYGDQGAAWASDKQFASVGFESTFEFQVSGGAGDAFAFVLQNAGDNALGRLAGYKEIPNSLAVEFDVGYDPQNGDPDDNHVSVHTRGVERNDVDHAYAIGCVTAPFDIDDGSTHTVKITYTPGILDIYLTDLTIPALTVPIDLAETLDLDVGRSYVGFYRIGRAKFRHTQLALPEHC